MEFNIPIPTSKVYVLVDERNRITRVEGQYSLPPDLTGWVLIEEGPPCDRLNLAQSHYFPSGLYTLDGIPRYRLEGGQPLERTAEEIEADRPPQPEPTPTIEERVNTLELDSAETREALELILSGVTE